MNTIRRLSPDVIAKIAAGEVIERPVYAVKELVENAIDAEATVIQVALEDSGLQRIVVRDNGVGMSRQDLELCFLPHTTSKIQSAADLDSIESLGFRGEALGSLATVSKLSIQSRRKNDTVGMKIEVENGLLKEVAPVGMAAGTKVEVRDLFYSTPVRQKFLKSKQTELRFITRLISQYALAFPRIRFFVRHNGKNIISELSAKDSSERISLALGKSSLQYLIPFEYRQNQYKVQGYLARPQLSTTSASRQLIFVNNRSIQNEGLRKAIRSAFGTLLEPTTSPVFILFISLPSEYVDFNVHPRKEEVVFHQEEYIRTFIEDIIRQTLRKHNLTYVDRRWKQGEQVYTSVREGTIDEDTATILKEEVSEYVPSKQEVLKNEAYTQLHNLYLVVPTKNGFILVDQHAAHERVLYEEFMKALHKHIDKKNIHTLKKPVRVGISAAQNELFLEYGENFSRLGFVISIDKEQTLLISAVPVMFKNKSLTELLPSLLDELEEYSELRNFDLATQRMVTYLACRSAIKAGDTLEQNEMKKLMEQLQKTEHRYTCPHGRPTMYEMLLKDLSRIFKRG